ncbi:MAG: hypothetical protein NZM17_10710 [Pyrinomonadaceae bacterium]|nr:hypothetical protein [Pyrinomonadaceae bacterium]
MTGDVIPSNMKEIAIKHNNLVLQQLVKVLHQRKVSAEMIKIKKIELSGKALLMTLLNSNPPKISLSLSLKKS